MKRRYISTLILIAAYLLGAGDATGQDSAATIVGTVLDSTTGLPIPDVSIYVDGQQAVSNTDHAGEFTVRNILNGTHAVLLVANGYTPAMVRFELPDSVFGVIDVGLVVMTTGEDPEAVISGTVLDSHGEEPVFGVEVKLNGETVAMTNILGRFSIENAAVMWGSNVLAFKRIGYEPLTTDLWVTEQTTDLDLGVTVVPTAVTLDEVVVEGDRTTYVRGLTRSFYRRRRIEAGSFFDRHEIEAIRPRVVTDILRRGSGTTIVHDGFGNQYIRFRRSLSYGDCPPLLFLNGARLDKIDDIDWFVAPENVLGIEMYQGAQIPLQFLQTGASCGVVVVWTK